MTCHQLAVEHDVGTGRASPLARELVDDGHKLFLTFLKHRGHAPPFDACLLTKRNVRRARRWLRKRAGKGMARMLAGTLGLTSAWLAAEGFLRTDRLGGNSHTVRSMRQMLWSGEAGVAPGASEVRRPALAIASPAGEPRTKTM